MDTISLSLLGPVRVLLPNSSEPVFLQQSCQSVLAYLLLHREESCTRAQLLGAFWPERSEARARRCLSTTLWRLRSALEPDGVVQGSYLIATEGDRVGFNWQSDYWLDIQAFERVLRPFLQTPAEKIQPCQAVAAESALKLYRGDLVEEYDDDWILREREHVRRLELNSLRHLMRYYRLAEDFENSLTCGRRILEQDPLREDIHRAMMRLYAALGRRVRAVCQYDLCCQLLDEELGIGPMEETHALYHSIAQLAAYPEQSARTQDLSCAHEQVLDELNDALRQAEKVQRRLQRAMIHARATSERLSALNDETPDPIFT